MARALYQGSYAFRSVNGLLAMLVTGTFGAAFIWVSVQCLTKHPGQLSKFVGVAFAIGAIGLFGASLYALIAIMLGRVVNVTVATNGITHGQRFVPWEEISEFYGTVCDDGICLGYTPAKRKFFTERKLSTTPLLTNDQYRELTEGIRECISATQEHLRIEMTPRELTGA